MPTLSWIGKEKVVNHHLEVPYRVLEHRYGYRAENTDDKSFTGSGNMIIHGDNLEALKALLPEYEGKVKCIYIDPPYNTGNEGWVYNDNVNHPKIQKWLGDVVGKQDEDFTRHDKWLCMMYPRLKLLQRLLKEDGSIVISISFHELGNLLQLCREIFVGKQIVTATVQTSGGKPSCGFSYTNEYLVFVTPIDFTPNASEDLMNEYSTPYHGMNLATFNQVQRPNQAYPIFINEEGVLVKVGKSLQALIDDGEYIGDPKDFVFDYDNVPEGLSVVWPVTSKGDPCVWRLIPSRLINDWKSGYVKIVRQSSKNNKNRFTVQYLADGIIQRIKSGEFETYRASDNEDIPTIDVLNYKTGGVSVPTLWTDKKYYTSRGSSQITEILGNKNAFTYPKSLDLIQDVLSRLSSKNDLILDSFAGSGTTAHAVLNLNKKDDGKRKFILVEMEDYADTITAERVRKVMSGYADTEGTGGCFDFYELGETLFKADGTLNESVDEDRIREYVYYTETKQHLSRKRESRNRYLLDTWNGVGYYLYYEPNQETAFTYDRLSIIGEKAERYIVYADTCTIDKDYLTDKNIIFRKIPRDIQKF